MKFFKKLNISAVISGYRWKTHLWKVTEMTNAKPKNIFKNRLNNYDNMDPVDAEFEEAMKQYEYKKRIAKAKNIHPYPVYNTEKSGYLRGLSWWLTCARYAKAPRMPFGKNWLYGIWTELMALQLWPKCLNCGFSGKRLPKMLPTLKESALHGIHIMPQSHCPSI